jgi:hypothetical protein
MLMRKKREVVLGGGGGLLGKPTPVTTDDPRAPRSPADVALHLIGAELRAIRDLDKRKLDSHLRSLEHEIARARTALADDKELPTNIIKNACDVDAIIMRWNTAIQLLPIVERDYETEK